MFKLIKKNCKCVEEVLFMNKEEEKVLDQFITYVKENTLTLYTENDFDILRRDKFDTVEDNYIYVK